MQNDEIPHPPDGGFGMTMFLFKERGGKQGRFEQKLTLF